MTHLAFLGHRSSEAIVACGPGRAVTVAEFERDVSGLVQALPARRHVINLCEDRYRFAVGFAAALVRGQVTLLPATRAPGALVSVAQTYGDVYALADTPVDLPSCSLVRYPERRIGPDLDQPIAFGATQLAAIAFTSGSTGEPTPHPKTWGQLVRVASGEAAAFGLTGLERCALVATVPPQHMYGLETSVLMPLHTGLSMHSGRPFYASDVQHALEQVEVERVLVTTPVHLRTLLAERTPLPPLRLIVSATAPLAAELARDAEARYRAALHEVYGFTEAGAVATRRTIEGERWCTLPGVTVRTDPTGTWFEGGHLPRAIQVTDVVSRHAPHSFSLEGRGADVVNIAGKRTSLAYLNHVINSIQGVEDAVFFLPEERSHGVTRLAAFVVAPGLDRERLFAALRARIDAAFMPRPLYWVNALPRNATGKLPREVLVRLAASLSASQR
jgi:acyl-coenzyme A synthetase/AMP-(fatty) acid ligase